jgi:putative radical SAM enzyme (TIGR03279 family)
VPEIREKLLLNPKAKEILKELNWLASLEIPFHAQLVICPGINDGEALTQSLDDLAKLRPYCESIAVIPVGLTQHRGNLPDLVSVTSETAQAVLLRLEAFWGDSPDLKEFAFASDEFYVLAKRPLPQYTSYGEFPQLDDGVGNSRLLSESFFELLSSLPQAVIPSRNFLIVTGELGKMTLDPIAQKLNNTVEGLYVDVQAIQNNFWGSEVTVAGLITATDILATLSIQDLSGYKAILIPQTMVREDTINNQQLFLDGLTVKEVSEKLNCPIWVVQKPDRAENLIELLFKS